MEYNHFTYCERLARHLKAVAHTDARPRFFTAFGLEDLYNFEDRLSGVTGTVMIAVDGQESESADNRADALSDNDTYSIILARNTQRDKPQTINEAVAACKQLAKVELFDIYRGEKLGAGKKSMAFSLSLADPKKEVSAEEAERAVKKILGNLKFKLGIEIRE